MRVVLVQFAIFTTTTAERTMIEKRTKAVKADESGFEEWRKEEWREFCEEATQTFE